MKCRISAVGCELFLVVILSLGFTGSSISAQGFAPETASARFSTARGWNTTLFASEPLVRQCSFVKVDSRGRVWTIQYLQYPNPAGLKRLSVDRFSRTVYDQVPLPPPHGPKGADKISLLMDTDFDGVADECRDVITDLNLATGVEFGYSGIFVLQLPYLLFYPDRDQNDEPDSEPEVLLSGFGMEDTQSVANHLTWGPDGWLYGVTGSTATNRVRDHEFQQAVWRYHPRTKDFEIFCEGGGNLFGLAFDDVGNMFFSSNGGHVCCHGVQGAYYEKSFAKHGPLHNPFAYGWFKPIRKRTPYSGGPTPGTILLTGDSIPSEMRGSLAGADFLGHRILWWKIHPAGSTFELDLGGELFSANDTWSSPTDLAQGPDGSVYVSDFYDRRTAHPDPDAEWDRSNGRIYQIQPLGAHSSPLDLTIRTNSELIRLLEDNHAWYRRRAAAELVARNDRSILPEVHQLFRSQVVRDTLEASWLLHSMDALDESMLQQMLEHSRDEVRSWGVRLAGDRKTISSGISGILESMARQDDSIHVRSQLVATAGRLSHETGISILVGWMDRDVDQRDPFVPWRAWWSLEKHCTTSPLELISQMTQGKRPQKNSFRENLLRLARRYASGSGNNDVELDERLGEACATILRSNANEIPTEWLESVSLGLSERGKRSGGMGMGNLYETYAVRSSEVTPSAVRPANSLAVFLEQLWRADSGNLLKTRLAIQSGCDDAERAAIDNASDPQLPESSRLHWIESVTRFGASDCSSQAMSLYLHVEESAAIRRAALSLLEKQLSLENGQKLLATYSQVSPPLRADIRRLLLRRPNTANLLLSKVEAGAIAHQEFSLDELRHLANFQDRQLDRILRRYWGSLQPGTQEEKLAEIRRLNNDLRAGSGDPANGAKLFRDHCSVCHIRDGQGGRVGPELTNINRDRDALLVSIVDPSSTIRPEYVSSTVLLDDESIVSGIVQSKNDSQLVLLDAQGRLQTLSLAKIRELKESTTSIMPERLLNKLTPQELRDLFALLQSAPSQEK